MSQPRPGGPRRHPCDGGVSPLVTLTDGVVTIRRQSPDDLETQLAAVDAEQMRWLWEPGERGIYEAMSPAERREHQLRHLQERHDTFGPGPKWCWSVDLADARYVAYVDCDLANDNVPTGQANISYACWPESRGQGYTSRAVRLVCEFLRRETAARQAHVLVEPSNVASLRVARSVGAIEVERFLDGHRRTMVRHIIEL